MGDDVPVLNDPIVAVGIEEVEGHPLGRAVVEGLACMDERLAAVFEGPDDSDVANRIPGGERFEELHETFNAVSNTR